MTRINVVPPSELTDKHLIAEWHELPRLYGLVKAAEMRGEKPNLKEVPDYVLGNGHVRFFYPRLGYISVRFLALAAEMLNRGFKIRHFSPPKPTIRFDWYGHYEPTEQALALNRARLRERNG